MTGLVLHHLPPSPNNIKVRLALGLRRIPVELVAVDPRDRAALVRISGQPLSPVLVHEGRVIYDSYAILRYLDANLPGEPRLYSADYAAMKAIEGWELWARTALGAAVGAVFGQYFAPAADPAALEAANAALAEHARKVEQALDGHEFLTGAAPNAADLSVAAMLAPTRYDASQAPAGSIQRFFLDHFQLPPDAPRTAAWLERVLAYDVAG